MLHAQLGSRCRARPRQLVTQATLGNPLFALEVGRALQASGRCPGRASRSRCPGAVEELLGTRVAALPEPVRRVLLALALGGERARRRARGGRRRAERSREARRTPGWPSRTGTAIRAAHPLLAAAARRRPAGRERRALHRALAAAAGRGAAGASPRPRDGRAGPGPGRHGRGRLGPRRACAAPAATRSCTREEALRLTPPATPSAPSGCSSSPPSSRPPASARSSPRCSRPSSTTLPPGAARVRAWLLLKPSAPRHRHVRAARASTSSARCASAGPTARCAPACSPTGRCSRPPRASSGWRRRRRWAEEALARRTRDRAGRRDGRRCARSAGRAASAGCRSTTSCARYAAAAPPAAAIIDAPGTVQGLRHLWRGEIAAARAIFDRDTALADERGEAVSYAWLRLNQCELGLRTGDMGRGRAPPGRVGAVLRRRAARRPDPPALPRAARRGPR